VPSEATSPQLLRNSHFGELNLNTSSPLQVKQSQSQDLKGDLAEFEVWIEPPDAIEGYVPKSTSKSTSHLDSDFKSEMIFPNDTPIPTPTSHHFKDKTFLITYQSSSRALLFTKGLPQVKDQNPPHHRPSLKQPKILPQVRFISNLLQLMPLLTTNLLNFFSYDHCRCR
jgi:hypothetical protein